MCNRISLTTELSRLSDQFQLDPVEFAYEPKDAFEPTQALPVILRKNQSNRLEEFRWGLVPFWAKDAVLADSQLVHEKPAYRKMFAKQRCVIPCNGYDLLKKVGKKKQVSLRVSLKNEGTFGVAGLYEIWQDTRGAEYRTCTVMTTRPNRLVYEHGDYMPVILNAEEMDTWLSDTVSNPEVLQRLLKPYDPDVMELTYL
jgi:putative SOS response-associated peptidase YedK